MPLILSNLGLSLFESGRLKYLHLLQPTRAFEALGSSDPTAATLGLGLQAASTAVLFALAWRAVVGSQRGGGRSGV